MKKTVYAISSNDADGAPEFIDVYENPKEAAWKFFNSCGFMIGRFDTLIHFAQENGSAKITEMRQLELIELQVEFDNNSEIDHIFCLFDENWNEYHSKGFVLARVEIGE